MAQPGDLVILATFADMDSEEAREYEPTVVRVDGRNRIIDTKPEQANTLFDPSRSYWT